MMNLSLFHSLIVVMIVVGVSCGDPPAGADPICGDGVVNQVLKHAMTATSLKRTPVSRRVKTLAAATLRAYRHRRMR